MNDVVTAATGCRRVLVTGFGPFPGAPRNPTLDMLVRIEAGGIAGVDLVTARLPVTFAGVASALQAAARCRPDAILLLGLARGRRILHVETMARNVAGQGAPDTDGEVPARSTIVEAAPEIYEATWPAAAIRTALADAGHEATLSDDAGSYVCNAALFHALHNGLAPVIGFLHVPPVRTGGPTIDALADAARVVVGVLARGVSTAQRTPVAARPPPDRRR